MTVGDWLVETYSGCTEADFAHMDEQLAKLPPDEPMSDSALLAELFLCVRAMEKAEKPVDCDMSR